MRMPVLRLSLCLAAATAALPATASADAIDGDWCQGVRHFAIRGPAIVTPAGTATTGQYDRHGFAYTVPAGDPGAGMAIDMIQINEQTIQVREGGSEPQIWKRCAAPIS